MNLVFKSTNCPTDSILFRLSFWKKSSSLRSSDNIPYILCGVAEFAASNAGTQIEVADTDSLILELVGKGIVALSHSADKHTDTLVATERLYIISDAHDLCIETKRDLSAVRRQVVCDWVRDHFEQFLLAVFGPDR